MIWIPIVFLCTQAGCFFMSAPPEYSAAACLKVLQVAEVELQENPAVLRAATDCVSVALS